MSHTPNELHEIFPDKEALIHRLKAENAHFARLVDEHHEVNREVHRAETDVAPMSDAAVVELRKRRLQLQDEIAAMMRDAD